MLKLRPYQKDGVDNIRQKFIEKKKSPLFVLSTGGGKTVIFCHIAKQTKLNGKNVLILVHRVELLRQTSKALLKSNVEHGLINPKYSQDLSKNVQIASVQTLVNRLDKIKKPDLIIIDEAHHATAGSWRKIIEYFSDALILGVTATPIRGDGTGLNFIFDSLVIGPQTSDLIEMGYLVKPIIYAPKTNIDLSEVKIVRGDYDSKEVQKIIDKPKIIGSAVEHYKKICPGVPTVVFCVSVKHAEHVAQEFRNNGFKSYSVDGEMDDDQRNRILNGLGNGEVEVVTSCDLISEGTDIPAIGCAILLRPTQSLGLYIQQVGRALRLSDGKDKAIILDHVGNVLNHGFPDEDRNWSLEGKKRTKKTIKEDLKDIRIRQCEQCYIVHEPADICPNCGFVYKTKYRTPQEIEGELIEIKRQDQIKKRELKEQKKKEIKNAKTMSELLVLQKKYGFKNGWARFQYNMKTGKFFK